jgi:hypothetical protein
VTSAHCFEEITGVRSGLLEPGVNGYPQTREARDLLAPGLGQEFILLRPEPGSYPWDRELGEVTAITVMPGIDIALLAVHSVKPGDGSPSFAEIPGLPEAFLYRAPVPGQIASFVARTSASDNFLVGGTGVYLGRIPNISTDGGPSRTLDFVALSPAAPELDPAYFGGSGSTAMLGGLGGSRMFGPLSMRFSRGYGGRPPQPPDTPSSSDWSLFQSALHVRLPRNKFNTLACFTVVTPGVLQALEAGVGKHIRMLQP